MDSELNRTMDQTSFNEPTEPQGKELSVVLNPDNKKKGLFEILLIGIILVIFLGILNYFNILPLSKLFPNQEPKQYKNVTIAPTLSPTDQAKQTLTSFLPTILTPSFLPKSPFDIALTEDREDKEKLNASWNIQGGGTTWAVFPNTPNSKKLTTIDVFFEKIQTASPSVELAKSNISQVFSISPKGEWKCSKDPLNERKLYCENFWEDQEAKKGVGFLIINTSQFRGRLIYSFCEHSKESKDYSWKSCAYEFAQTGVTP